MASQVLSGSGNVSYTNNTGQNVRVVINFLSTGNIFSVSWAGVSISSSATGSTFGRNLAFSVFPGTTGTASQNNACSAVAGTAFMVPTELMLAPGQTFSVIGSNPNNPIFAYNIVVIPEGG